MSCILYGMIEFGLLAVALRPLAPAALRVLDQISSRITWTPEPELVPIRVNRRANR